MTALVAEARRLRGRPATHADRRPCGRTQRRGRRVEVVEAPGREKLLLEIYEKTTEAAAVQGPIHVAGLPRRGLAARRGPQPAPELRRALPESIVAGRELCNAASAS